MTESTKKAAVAATFHRFTESGDLGAECAVHEGPEQMCLTWGDGGRTLVSRGELAGMFDALMWHGAKQKLIDAAAIGRNPDTGKSATIADKRAAVIEVLERLRAGQWNKTREGGGSGTLLLAALTRFYPNKSSAALSEYLDGLEAEQKRALERNPKIAPIIEAIRTERRLAAGKVGDGEDLLSEIDAIE